MPVETPEVLHIARRLVRARSANPPGDTTEAADVVEAELSGTLEITRLEPMPGFVSVVASHTFPQSGPTLIFCGHLDVVPVDQRLDRWTRDPWAAEVADGWLYGRGSLDMKGAVAAMIVAIRRAVRGTPGLCGQLVLAAVADEERGGQLGAGTVVTSAVTGGDGVIIGEPGDGGISVAHRGMCFVELTTQGLASHASAPTAGINAVTSMVKVLNALQGIQLTHIPHPLLGRPSIAIGTMISGGTTANVIPDSCQATLDIRKVPGMSDDSVLADLSRHLAAAGITNGVACRIAASVEPAVTQADEPIVYAASESFREEFGQVPSIRGLAASTDGWWFRNRLGIPTVMALGPGRIRDCHTVDERVAIADLESYTRIYEGIIRRFLSGEAQPQ